MDYCLDEETVTHCKLLPEENWLNYRSNVEIAKNMCATTCGARRRERSATDGESRFLQSKKLWGHTTEKESSKFEVGTRMTPSKEIQEKP